MIFSKRSKEGYLLIDHRASPGLPKDFHKKIGLDAPSVPEGASFEAPTMTCAHCNAIVIMNPLRTRPRNYCRKCDDYVCDDPKCSHECTPFSKILDDVEKLALKGKLTSFDLKGNM